MKSEDVLELLRACGALLEGHFELRSGLHSDRFFQCANVLRYPLAAARLCEALAAKVRAGLPDPLPVDAVISPALGGILVGHEMARALGDAAVPTALPAIFAEKQDGKLVMRRFAIRPGQRYLVAEDVVTRGGRVQETVEIVQAAGGVVTAIALLVDRSGGKAVFEPPTFSLLRMEPVTWQPAACPLCAAGTPFEHPGS